MAARLTRIARRAHCTPQLLPLAAYQLHLHHSCTTGSASRYARLQQAYMQSEPLRRHHSTLPPSLPSSSERQVPPGVAPNEPTKDSPSWVIMMNRAIKQYPVETGIGFMVMDATSIITAYLLLSRGLHWEVPVDFAVAFGASRLLRRLRLPLDAAFAAVLARMYPPLTQVNPLQALFARLRPSASEPVPAAGVVAMGKHAMQTVAKLVDRFGLALLVSQRMFVGLASVLSIYCALRLGVDVQSYLSAVGIDASGVGKMAGQWAAAACCAAPFFPLVVLGAGRIGLFAGPLRQAAMTRWANRQSK